MLLFLLIELFYSIARPQTGALFLADFKSVKFKRLLRLTKVFFRRGVFLSSGSVLAAKGAPRPRGWMSPDTPGLMDHGSWTHSDCRAGTTGPETIGALLASIRPES